MAQYIAPIARLRLMRRLSALAVLCAVLLSATTSVDGAAPSVPAYTSPQQIYDMNAPAVVVIALFNAQGEVVTLGSGFIVTSTGVIVTNQHVIEPRAGTRLVIMLPRGDRFEDVAIIHVDARRDFAVLKIKASGLPAVTLGASATVRVGDAVFALGNPKGLVLTFTQGIVSALRLDAQAGYSFIQHQAPLSPGSSGGALLNARGEVIGINAFKITGGENLNAAIPIDYVKPYVHDRPSMSYEEYARAQGQVGPPSPTARPTVPAPPGGMLIAGGRGIGAIAIGMERDDVIATLSTERLSSRDEAGGISDVWPDSAGPYGGLFMRSGISGLVDLVGVSNNPRFTTREGLHASSSEADVRAALGVPSRVESVAGLTHFYYDASGIRFSLFQGAVLVIVVYPPW